MLQAGWSRVRIPMRALHFSIDLILPAVLCMALGSTKPVQKSVPGIFLEVKGGRRVGLKTLPPSVCRLSRENMGASTFHDRMGLHGLLQG
jgi:hypothetical protein